MALSLTEYKFCHRGPIWIRAVLGEFKGIIDDGFHIDGNLIKLWLRDTAIGHDFAREQFDRIALFPLLDVVHAAITAVTHAFGVGPGTIGLALDQGRPAACARPIDSFARGLVDRQHVVTIHAHAWDAITGGLVQISGLRVAYVIAISVAN